MRIMLDAGHGGRDSGAIGATEVPEKDIALGVVLQMGGLLHGLLHQVEYTRRTDVYPTLEDRCKMATNWDADLLVSIHCNGWKTPDPSGFEVFTDPKHDQADRLASEMWYEFRKTFPDMRGRADFSDDNPDKNAKFYVLVNFKGPAVLFELAFITNPGDEKRLLTPSWTTKAAFALVASINRWSK